MLMTPIYLDPAPRTYPPFVELLRRSERGPCAAGDCNSFECLEQWLLGDAINEQSMLSLAESLAWRMVAAGLPIVRATIHTGTLHPQLTGFSWIWSKDDGLADEVLIKAMSRQSDAFLKSPLVEPIQDGKTLILDTGIEANRERYPIIDDLYKQGIHHYLVLPLPKRIGAKRHDVVTIATDAKDGFTEEQKQRLSRVLHYLSLHVHRHAAHQTALNVMNVYLGNYAGKRVMEGSIARGDGHRIKAVVWFADMRDFSSLSEQFSASDVNTVLNGFLDQLVRAVTQHGGDVLKFMGDGLLAVFPIDEENSAADAANAALKAAETALENLDNFNTSPPEEIACIKNCPALRCGIAMHKGEVFFGNVGGQARLDFTVVGSAVNEASRLEQLTKRVMRPVLMSHEVAELIDTSVDDCGEHELKGFEHPVRVFAPSHWKSTAIIL